MNSQKVCSAKSHTEQPSFHVSVYKQHLYVVWYLACIYLVSRMLFRKESFHCILVTVCFVIVVYSKLWGHICVNIYVRGINTDVLSMLWSGTTRWVLYVSQDRDASTEMQSRTRCFDGISHLNIPCVFCWILVLVILAYGVGLLVSLWEDNIIVVYHQLCWLYLIHACNIFDVYHAC